MDVKSPASAQEAPPHDEEELGFYRSAGEERLNAAIHAGGLALSLLAAVHTGFAAGPLPWQVQVALAAYLLTLAGMYFVSMMSHAVTAPLPKHRWRVFDQGVIYLLIVGTYTPIVAALVPPPVRAVSLTLLWAAAAFGCLRKVLWQRDIIQFSAKSYLALGWTPAICLQSFVPLGVLVGLFIGGVFYSAGAWLLINDRRAWYFHGLWHVLVILASACHYCTIWRYVLAARPPLGP